MNNSEPSVSESSIDRLVTAAGEILTQLARVVVGQQEVIDQFSIEKGVPPGVVIVIKSDGNCFERQRKCHCPMGWDTTGPKAILAPSIPLP